MTKIDAQIEQLHDHYIAAVNNAVEAGDLTTVAELADAFDREVVQARAEIQPQSVQSLPRRRRLFSRAA